MESNKQTNKQNKTELRDTENSLVVSRGGGGRRAKWEMGEGSQKV